MIEISFWKICVVLIVGLIVLGPKQLPKVARALGRIVGQLRTLSHNLQKEVNSAAEKEDKKE